jgi:hypothetical protein
MYFAAGDFMKAFKVGDLVTFLNDPRSGTSKAYRINGVPSDLLGEVIGLNGRWVEIHMSFSSGRTRRVRAKELRKV